VVHNRFPGIKLVASVHIHDYKTYYLSPHLSINAGSTEQTSLVINTAQYGSISTLIYRLQREDIEQSNEEEATCTQLVIMWAVYSFGFSVYSFLIEVMFGI
jgi:hypothetical protein